MTGFEMNETPVREIKRLPVEFYNQFLSTLAKERTPSPIRALLSLEKTPGMMSLFAGKPNASTFPITSLSFTVRSPKDAEKEYPLTIEGSELVAALQYGDTNGISGLLDWMYGLQEIFHDRKRGEGWRISAGSGSQDLIYKAVHSIINPGDTVLVESPTYAGVIPIFTGLHCNQIEVETDAQGICSSSLRSVLEQWPQGQPKPKVLYTIPFGCNPTGASATVKRRKEVLQLAREHNFLILEDDPYYYLYYGKDPRYPSYFALELEEEEVGRVLRFDSLSKVLSAGMRIGFASGPEPLLTAIDEYSATSNLQSSSFTQAVALKLLRSWGYDGFKAHTESIAEFYSRRRDSFQAAMNKHLTGLAEWKSPEAGMFFWFKILLTDDGNGGDSEAVIRTKAFEKGILAMPGTHFLPNSRPTPYVRASFSVLAEGDVEKAVMRLRDAILEAKEEVKTCKVSVM